MRVDLGEQMQRPRDPNPEGGSHTSSVADPGGGYPAMTPIEVGDGVCPPRGQKEQFNCEFVEM